MDNGFLLGFLKQWRTNQQLYVVRNLPNLTHQCECLCYSSQTRPTDRASFLVNKLNAEVNNSANTKTKTPVALWCGGQCLNGGCFGGVDQLANAA
eukprot:5745334-Pleurochrysis_carterae.AAC.1